MSPAPCPGSYLWKGPDPGSNVIAQVCFCLAAFRSGPVLLDPGPASLGQELHLRCDLTGLVWANQVRMQWLVGGATLKTETSSVDGSARQNLSSLLQLQVEQKQLLVTCRAALLHQDGAELLARSSSLQLSVHCEPDL